MALHHIRCGLDSFLSCNVFSLCFFNLCNSLLLIQTMLDAFQKESTCCFESLMEKCHSQAEDTFFTESCASNGIQVFRQNHAMRSLSSLAIPQGKSKWEEESGAGLNPHWLQFCWLHLPLLTCPPHPPLHPGSATAPPSSSLEMLLCSAVGDSCVFVNSWDRLYQED